MDGSQGANDALTEHSSERPGEDGHIERLLGQAGLCDVVYPEGDHRLEGYGRGGYRLVDALRVGIERQDRPCQGGVAPRHPAIATPDLQHIRITEIDQLVENPRLVALRIDRVSHR